MAVAVAMAQTVLAALVALEAQQRARLALLQQATAVVAVVVVQAGQRPATAAMALAATS